ncbi:MAG: LysR substrate-binding domain-containing protein [Hyphomicrobiales bacterium]
MAPINLPTDLLRTFITVIDLGGYTKAGAALSRTQPAISLQMKRLEALVGCKLLMHDGRGLHLTSDGKTLAGYARQILRFNDEAVARFHERDPQGGLRIGLPTDYALAFLQSAVTSFIRDNREVDVEVHCDLSRGLLADLHADRLDLAVALTNTTDEHYLVRMWEEQPIWAGAKGGRSHKRDPLPLVSHPEGCEYRNRVVEALNGQHRAWRIAYSSPGITGLQEAVSADLGVSALTRKTLRPDMRILNKRQGLPPLAKIRIGLFYKHPRLSDAGLMLVDHIIASLDEATDADFGPSEHPSAQAPA